MIITDFHRFTDHEDKLENYSNLKFYANFWVSDLGQNLIMTKTS